VSTSGRRQPAEVRHVNVTRIEAWQEMWIMQWSHRLAPTIHESLGQSTLQVLFIPACSRTKHICLTDLD
jgi:hypothetical protein